MVESRVDNIASFINDLVDKLVLEAMDILDLNSEDADRYWRRIHAKCTLPDCGKCNDRKSRNFSLRVAQQRHPRVEKSFSCQGDRERSLEMSQFPPTLLPPTDIRVHDHNLTFDVDQCASEEIRNIVQGLRGVQIGDSSLVQPVTQVPSLVMQVKRAIEDVRNAPEISETNELSSTEGQGDVSERGFHGTLPAAVVEIDEQIKSASLERLEVLENNDDEGNRPLQWQLQQHLQEQQEEVSKLRSTCFLHRAIKESMSAEATQKNAMKVSNSISAVSQERIAAWEEKEEKFIRIIESSREESLDNEVDDSFPIFFLDKVPADIIVEVEIEEINSKPISPTATPPSLPSPRALPPAPPNSSPRRDGKKDTTVLQLHETNLEKSKSRNKMRVGERLRRFFRAAFKRGKDS